MKRIYLVGFITTALFLAVSASAWAQEPPITVAFSDPSKPGLLRVSLMQGNLTIKAHTGRDVIIQTKTRASSDRRGRRADAEVQGLKRLDAVSTGLSVEEENNIMTVGSNRMSNSIDLEIQVPTRTNLKLNILNGDSLIIQGVDGDIDASNQNGDLSLTDVSGSVLAHSNNGNVKVSMKRLTPQKPMSFTSLNGNVDVTLPADTKANLKLRTDNGDVYTDFEVQIRANAAPVIEDSRKSGGRVRINVDKSVLGAINGGGPDFELRSFNGNVYIRKLK